MAKCKDCRGSGIVVRLQTAEAREPDVTHIAWDSFHHAMPALKARFVSYFCQSCNGNGQAKESMNYFGKASA